MKNKKNKITSKTKKDLETELYELLHVKRPLVIQEISDARSQGDLSENAEFDAAREKQAHLETRIKEIQDLLENSIIIKKISSKIVSLGSKVELKHLKTKATFSVEIIGTIGVDPFSEPKKISIDSPIGSALLNKKVGDVIIIKVNNPYKVEIIKVY